MSNYFDQYGIPRSAIERVNIGNQKGQYIIGNVEYDNSGKPSWNPKLPFKRVIWQGDGLWMEITLGGDSAMIYDKDDLLSTAESLR